MEQSGESSAVITAVNWLVSLATGSAATTFGIIAIASVGFLMLSGRVEIRRAAAAILGCFLVFGASHIATGLIVAVRQGDTLQSVDALPPIPPYPQAPATPKGARAASGNNVYTSASLPAQ